MAFYHILSHPTAPVASTSATVAQALPATTPAGLSGYTPAELRKAYGIDSINVGAIVGNGAGQTIAIVDVYDNPDLVDSTSPNFATSDLHVFDQQFGLPDPPSFIKLDENGGTNYPAASGSTGWAGEEDLDVEWAHVVAPQANIVLIEASSESDSDMMTTAVDTAKSLPGVSVVSMSYGEDETASNSTLNSVFTTPTSHTGVTFVAATGDNGPPSGYPAYSPNVIAVGGTTLTTQSDGTYVSEVGWSGSAGGLSAYQSEPSYQEGVQTSGSRENPDVSFDADPNTGVPIYDPYEASSDGNDDWTEIGGTSVGTPCWAGLIAIANQLRVADGLTTLDSPTQPTQTLEALYSLPSSDFHDITSGTATNGSRHHPITYTAGPGYDLVTGIGTPIANLLVPALASYDPLPATPPTVTGTTPSLTGGTLPVGATQISVNFSEAVVGGGTASNYQLQNAGPDGLLGTSDDVSIPLSVTYSGTTATLTFASLPENVYRLTVDDAINSGGDQLQGNGSAPSNYTADFVVVPGGGSSTAQFSAVTTWGSGGSTPDSVAVGDFVTGGQPDLAVVNQASNTVGILLNNGSGGFTATTTFSSGGSTPDGIVAGDFTGDGYLDLAVANFGSDDVAIFMGNGTGSFAAPVTYSCGGAPDGLVAADFNGDGYLDLAVANRSNGTVGVLLNDGKADPGALAPVTTYSSGGNGPWAIATGDFLGQGEADLAVVNYYSNSVGVLLNNGGGKVGGGLFSPVTTIASGGTSPAGIAAADFTGDGKADLAVTNASNSSVGIFLNNGSGAFSLAPTLSSGGLNPEGLVAGDFSGNGDMDLAVANAGSGTVGILLGNGNGDFAAAATVSAGGTPSSIAVGDFSGDGVPGLVLTESGTSGTVGVLTNTWGLAPVTLTSPDSVAFDVSASAFGTGELVAGGISGMTNAFNGDGRLMINGALFAPGTLSSTLSDSGQSLVTGNGTFSGLTVAREITVPDTGSQDFARTVDSFTNSGSTAVTVTVEYVGNLGSDADTTVFATSNGTTVAPSDQWIGTDGNGTPAIITYIHGPDGIEPATVSVTGDNIQWSYQLTVPAGQTLRLADFTIVAANTAAAEAAANALVTSSGFGGQAAALLTPAQLQSLANFVNLAGGDNTVGLFNPASSIFFLKNANSAGPADSMVGYGPANITPAWIPLAGDWDGNGSITLGLYNPLTSAFFLKNSNAAGPADIMFNFGPADPGYNGTTNIGWLPIVGDWTGSGTTTVGLYDPSSGTFYLRDSNTAGPADTMFGYGPGDQGWVPVVGDWTGSGTTTVGLYAPLTSTFYLKDSNSAGPADLTFGYGPAKAGWIPIAGSWTGASQQSVGLFDPRGSVFYLKDSNTAGPADITFGYGPSNANPAWVPIVGNWGGASPLAAAEKTGAAAGGPALLRADLAPVASAALAHWYASAAGGQPASLAPNETLVGTGLAGVGPSVNSGNTTLAASAAIEADGYAPFAPGGSRVDARAVDQIDLAAAVEEELGQGLGMAGQAASIDDLAHDLLSAGLGPAPGSNPLDAAFTDGLEGAAAVRV
jgi:hypothetical protein